MDQGERGANEKNVKKERAYGVGGTGNSLSLRSAALPAGRERPISPEARDGRHQQQRVLSGTQSLGTIGRPREHLSQQTREVIIKIYIGLGGRNVRKKGGESQRNWAFRKKMIRGEREGSPVE